MSTHVIKYEYKDGIKLDSPISWCGAPISNMEFLFQDAQHVALNVGGSTKPCKDCIKAIINELNEELEE